MCGVCGSLALIGKFLQIKRTLRNRWTFSADFSSNVSSNLIVFNSFTWAMKLIILFALIAHFAQPFKILVYNSKFGHSHSNFHGSVADALSEAGHNVVCSYLSSMIVVILTFLSQFLYCWRNSCGEILCNVRVCYPTIFLSQPKLYESVKSLIQTSLIPILDRNVRDGTTKSHIIYIEPVPEVEEK